MSSTPKAIVFGAGGNVGNYVLPALKQANIPTTIATRPGSKSTFSPDNKVVTVDYDSLDSLTSAIKGHDVVLSLVTARVAGSQKLLIDAAIAAGAKYFLPSEYGHDANNDEITPILPIFKAKREVLAYLREKEKDGLTWTGITTALFFDWGLPFNMFDIDLKGGKAKLWDEGKGTFSAANMDDISDAIVKLITDPAHRKKYLNQSVFVSSVQTTQADLLEATQEVTGKKFEISHASSEDWFAGDKSDVLTGLKVLQMSTRGFADYGKRNEEGKGQMLVDRRLELKPILEKVLATEVEVPEVLKGRH